MDRMVESPHLTSFYVRDASDTQWDESARYWLVETAPLDEPNT